MILESIITTLDEDGSVRITPMGPEVADGFDHFVLRPFQTSHTFANLRRTRQGVLHVTDDVELMARAAIGRFESPPPHRLAPSVRGVILEGACRWYAFEVESVDDSQPRANLHCRVVAEGRARDFLGFNRARHAVVELAILVTRLSLLAPQTVLNELRRLQPLVDKTGGAAEQRAFGLLQDFIHERCRVQISTPSRLHFGLFSFGNFGRQFGGVGAMIAQPRVQVSIKPSDQFRATGPLAADVAACAERCCAAWGVTDQPTCEIEVETAPPRHVGLGSGTQLACAVARGLNGWFHRPALTAEELARTAGRARRSAVGTYGFLQGGLIVESGRLAEEPLAPLHTRLALPAAWRFVLVARHAQTGLSGIDEQQAFAQLPPVSDATRQALIDEVEQHLLPAALAEDCQAFGHSLYRYGYAAGQCFAPVQGGPYNGPDIERLVAEIRSLGFPGVGQSSWGPTVFCVTEDQSAAERLKRELLALHPHEQLDVLITSPDNDGARVNDPW